MKSDIQAFVVCALLLTGSFTGFNSVYAHENQQQDPSGTPQGSGSEAVAPASSSPAQSELNSLKKQLLSQQREIEQMRAVLKKQQEVLQRLASSSESTPSAGAKAATGVSAPAAGSQARTATLQPLPLSAGREDGAVIADASLPSVVSDSTSAAPLPGRETGQQLNPAISNAPEAPIPLKIGSAVLTPVGFVDATEFFRSENLGSGIGGSFGSIPFSNTVAGQLTENRFTIQNSRIGMQLDDQFGANRVRGYLETDFLGAQPANAFVTSNSDSLRMRLYWLNLTRGRFEFLAGQSWSLLTPSRTGISPMPSDIF